MEYFDIPDQKLRTVSPDRRKHRGPHPRDRELFSDERLFDLRMATADLSFLLDRGYAPDSSLKIVGDRYRLTQRQRVAVRRATCPPATAKARRSRMLDIHASADKLLLDGFNVIVSVEAALAGGVLLHCMDDTIRDLASVHGSYRRVDETVQAVDRIADLLDQCRFSEIRWLLDRPVSNSGRLAGLLREIAAERSRPWSVELSDEVDLALATSGIPVATSDSGVLDQAPVWINLTREVVARMAPMPWIIDLSLS